MTTRKKYPKEFKLDAVSLVLEQEYTKAEASRSLGINPNLITMHHPFITYSYLFPTSSTFLP
jgi:hypothetical protein